MSQWYEGPEWEGWMKWGWDGAVQMVITRGTTTFSVREPGFLAIDSSVNDEYVSILCKSTEHARQIGEAWVKGWS